MKATIAHIHYPFCYTKCGKQIKIQDITGEPGINKVLEHKGNGWVVIGMQEKEEC